MQIRTGVTGGAVATRRALFLAGVGFLWALAHETTANADVVRYELDKDVDYVQTSNAQPTIPAFTFASLELDADPGDLTAARVTAASPSSPFTLDLQQPGFFQHQDQYNTIEDLDKNYPAGETYTYTISGGSLGMQSASLTLPSSDLFPTQIPYFTGDTYSRFHGLDATKDFTLTFSPFTPDPLANANSLILLLLTADGGTVLHGVTLDPGATSWVIPAGWLEPGTSYSILMAYNSQILTNNAGFNDRALSAISYDSEVRFAFTTATVPEPSGLVLSMSAMVLMAMIPAIRRSVARHP